MMKDALVRKISYKQKFTCQVFVWITYRISFMTRKCLNILHKFKILTFLQRTQGCLFLISHYVTREEIHTAQTFYDMLNIHTF